MYERKGAYKNVAKYINHENDLNAQPGSNKRI